MRNTDEESFIRSYLHISNAKHLESPSATEGRNQCCRLRCGRQQPLVRESPAVLVENNCWVILEAHPQAVWCHHVTLKPFKEGKYEAP